MDFKIHFENSWRVFTAYLPAMLISTIAMLAGSILSFGILAPVLSAGYMQSLLFALRESRKPELKDLILEMRLFLPLLGFSILIFLAVFIGLAMLVLPGLVVMLIICFFCMYMLPLMTDQDYALFDALRESYRMSVQKPVSEHLAVVVVYLVLTSVGTSTGLLSIVTTPFATLFVLSVYEAKRIRQLPGAGV